MDSPIIWYGGKSRLRDEIISLIPPHKTYIEPFGGAGWVLFHKPPSPVEVFNDLDNDLINLFMAIRDHMTEFIEILYKTPVSEALFNDLSSRYASTPSRATDGIPTVDLDRAIAMYYLVMNAFNGNLARSPSFRFDYDREPAFLKLFRTDWDKVTDRLKRVTFLNRDFVAVIESTDSKESFYYHDPPYLCATDNTRYYRYTFTLDDHKRLLVCLNALEGKFLLSYGDDPAIREMYSDFEIIQSATDPGELLIMNYTPPETPFYNVRDLNGVYPTSSHGIPNHPGDRRAPWPVPNCPNCRGRNLQQLYKRITYENNKRNWIPRGYECNDCGELIKLPGGE